MSHPFQKFLETLNKIDSVRGDFEEFEKINASCRAEKLSLADGLIRQTPQVVKILKHFSLEDRENYAKALRVLASQIGQTVFEEREKAKTQDKYSVLELEADGYANAYAKTFFELNGVKLTGAQWQAIRNKRLELLKSQRAGNTVGAAGNSAVPKQTIQ